MANFAKIVGHMKFKDRYRRLSPYITTDLIMYIIMIVIIAAGVIYILATE